MAGRPTALRSLSTAFLALATPLAALGQASGAGTPPSPEARPVPCTSPAHRQFDFWVGEWIVKDTATGGLTAAGVEGPPATAPAAPPPAAPPAGCTRPEHRQFDFWIGEWDVTRPDGRRAGRNHIESVLGGCALRESWEGTGMTGLSLSSFDPAAGAWHQTWVDSTGLLLKLDGSLEGPVMVLRGRAPTWGRQGLFLQEIRWTPRPGGEVQQTGRLSEDGGKTWSTIFDLTYRPSGRESGTPRRNSEGVMPKARRKAAVK